MDRQLLDISSQEVLQDIFGIYTEEYHEICYQVILCVTFYAYLNRFLNFKVKYIAASFIVDCEHIYFQTIFQNLFVLHFFNKPFLL